MRHSRLPDGDRCLAAAGHGRARATCAPSSAAADGRRAGEGALEHRREHVFRRARRADAARSAPTGPRP